MFLGAGTAFAAAALAGSLVGAVDDRLLHRPATPTQLAESRATGRTSALFLEILQRAAVVEARSNGAPWLC